MDKEQKRTARKNLDFVMAAIRTIAAIVGVAFNIYVFYHFLLRQVIRK